MYVVFKNETDIDVHVLFSIVTIWWKWIKWRQNFRGVSLLGNTSEYGRISRLKNDCCIGIKKTELTNTRKSMFIRAVRVSGRYSQQSSVVVQTDTD